MLSIETILGREVAPFSPGSPTTVYALVEIRPTGNQTTQTPIDVRWVQDESGSMDGEKLQACKAALSNMLGKLSSQDKLGVVAFNHDARVVIQRGNPGMLANLAAKFNISRMYAGGYTTIAPGFEMAMCWNPNGNVQPTIVLVTDGCSCHCDIAKDERELIEYARSASMQGYRIVVIGSGIEYNHRLLSEVTQQAPDSELFHLNTPDDVGHIIDDVMAELRGVYVHGLTIEAKAAPGVKFARVTSCVPVMRDVARNKTELNLDAGNLSRHRGQRLVLELKIPNPEAGHRELFTITASGKSGNQTADVVSDTDNVSVTLQEGASSKNRLVVRQALYCVLADDCTRAGDYNLAATYYEDAGRYDLAQEMREAAVHVEKYGIDDEVTRSVTSPSTHSMTEPTDFLPRGGTS